MNATHEIVALRKQGATYREIASATGLTAPTISAALASAGLKGPPQRNTSNAAADILRRYRDGQTTRAISDATGFDRSTIGRVVRKSLREEAVQATGGPGVEPAAVEALLDGGMTLNEVARSLGISNGATLLRCVRGMKPSISEEEGQRRIAAGEPLMAVGFRLRRHPKTNRHAIVRATHADQTPTSAPVVEPVEVDRDWAVAVLSRVPLVMAHEVIGVVLTRRGAI